MRPHNKRQRPPPPSTTILSGLCRACAFTLQALLFPLGSPQDDRNRAGIGSAQKGESHMFRRTFLFLAACGIISFASLRLAAEPESRYYLPHYFSTVDEALVHMHFLLPNSAPMALSGDMQYLTSGYSLEKVEVSKLGVNLLFTKSGTVVSSEYEWSWHGGYNAPVATQYTDDIVTTIPYDEIAYFSIWYFPKAKNFPDSWCARPVLKSVTRNPLLCFSNQQDAQGWIDVVATLAAAAREKYFITDYGFYGMDMGDVPEKELKKQPGETGCLVRWILLDSPPAKAGLKNNDIIHAVEGKPCAPDVFGSTLMNALTDPISKTVKPDGGAVHVEVYRKNQLLSFDLRYANPVASLNLASLKKSAEAMEQKNALPAAAPAPAAVQSPAPGGFHLGVQVRAVTDADVAPMGLAKARGIVVVDVEKGSLADKMGFLPGDVILEVNNSEIGDQELFGQYVRSGAAKKFKVWRKGQPLDLVVPESM